jgi:hypothetical protein
LTSRCTSTQLVAASGPGAGPAGGGPAGRAPALRSRARSTEDRRGGTVLIRDPPMLRCTAVVSVQKLTVWAVRLVPGQNCCGPLVARGRDDPVDLDGVRPGHGSRDYWCRSRSWHRGGDGLEFDRRSLSVEAGRCSVKQRVLGRTVAAMPESRGAGAERKRLDRDS